MISAEYPPSVSLLCKQGVQPSRDGQPHINLVITFLATELSRIATPHSLIRSMEESMEEPMDQDYYFSMLLSCRRFTLEYVPPFSDRDDLVVPICETGCLTSRVVRAFLTCCYPELRITCPLKGSPDSLPVEYLTTIQQGVATTIGNDHFSPPLTLAAIPKLIALIGQPHISKQEALVHKSGLYTKHLDSIILVTREMSKKLESLLSAVDSLGLKNDETIKHWPTNMLKRCEAIQQQMSQVLSPLPDCNTCSHDEMRLFFRNLRQAIHAATEHLEPISRSLEGWKQIHQSNIQTMAFSIQKLIKESLRIKHRLELTLKGIEKIAEDVRIRPIRRLVLLACSTQVVPQLQPFKSQHVAICTWNIPPYLETSLSVSDAAYKTSMIIDELVLKPQMKLL